MTAAERSPAPAGPDVRAKAAANAALAGVDPNAFGDIAAALRAPEAAIAPEAGPVTVTLASR